MDKGQMESGDLSGSTEGDLPPGQTAIGSILRWYVDHLGITKSPPRIDRGTWRLEVDGLVDNPLSLDWNSFLKLPHVERISDFHCVEGWSVRGCRWEGVLFKTLMVDAGASKQAKHSWFECADGYTTSLAVEELTDDDVLLSYKLDGVDLPLELGGPMRLVVPSKYAYKSPMWITRIAFTDSRKLGFWEKRGYSDTANIWSNDRYARK